MGQPEVKLQLGARSFFQISYTDGRGPNTSAFFNWFLQAICKELYEKWSNQKPNKHIYRMPASQVAVLAVTPQNWHLVSIFLKPFIWSNFGFFYHTPQNSSSFQPITTSVLYIFFKAVTLLTQKSAFTMYYWLLFDTVLEAENNAHTLSHSF